MVKRVARERSAPPPLGEMSVRLPENRRCFGKLHPKSVRELSSEHNLEVVRHGN